MAINKLDTTSHGVTKIRIGTKHRVGWSAMLAAIGFAAISTMGAPVVAYAGSDCADPLNLLCSRTTNETSELVIVARDWCGPDDTGGACATSDFLGLLPGEFTPPSEDWDVLWVPANCEYSGTVDGPFFDEAFFISGNLSGTYVHVHDDERYRVQHITCIEHSGDEPEPPTSDDGAGEADPPTTGSPQQSLPRRKSGIYAVGAGVDNASVDLLGARSDGYRFSAIANGRHASGFGWNGMKVVAGDFNGDARMDIGALGAGVDGHSVDFLVALGDGHGGYAPIANWRHANGFGWSGMKVVAGDFNGDGRWDIGAIGAGVNGQSVDLLVATSTGSGFNSIANWRHAEGYGWGGMKPVAGDFNGDGRWDIGAIGAGVDGASIDLLVAVSTTRGFTAIGNWRHAPGYGWGGLSPASL
jgi:hypothetical protein